ncbi:MAG: hypothetical protein AAGD32_12315 [Planctomycetota bacterium]
MSRDRVVMFGAIFLGAAVFALVRHLAGGWNDAVMLVALIIAVAIPIVAASWMWRRLRADLSWKNKLLAGFCPHCGYNRRGTDSAVCPECGR